MHEGDVISISGTTGEIVVGEVPVITPEPTGHFGTILGWADELPHAARCARTPTCPKTRSKAREFGAEGIGLCRTEHMFLGDRLPIVQRMILADTPDEEGAALEQLRAQQEADFVGILEAMDGLPVTVRLLDPPLHEFLPDHEELIVKQAKGEIDRRRAQAAARGRVLARVEPDARHARLPPRHHQARPVPHAGARADAGRGDAQAAPAATRSSRS